MSGQAQDSQSTDSPWPPRRSYTHCDKPHPHICVHISALQGRQVPCIVDEGMPADFHMCYPTVTPETILAAAAHPDLLKPLVKPRHVQMYRELTQDSNESDAQQPWRAALSHLAWATFDANCVAESQSQSSIRQPITRQSRMYTPLTTRMMDRPETMEDPPSVEKWDLLESTIMSMLCRILQTSDTRAVQAWLLAATPRERRLVSDMIRSAVANKDEYFHTTPLALQASLPGLAPSTRSNSRHPATQSSRKGFSTSRLDRADLSGTPKMEAIVGTKKQLCQHSGEDKKG